MLNRRQFAASLTTALLGTVALPLTPSAANQSSGLRGSIDVSPYELVPGSTIDQGHALNRLLRDAASAGLPVVLPAGDYVVSDVELPEGIDFSGSAGATRLIRGGGERLLSARSLKRLRLSGLVIDGVSRPFGPEIGGLLDLRDIADLSIDGCAIAGSSAHGIRAEACGGRIAGNRITTAAMAGLYAVESRALSITGNTVSDCGNGGILVHRWEAGADGTMISGNRISRIAALAGGTGENGNGINVFRAANVMVTGNHVSDCAFSAIRANAATNVQITDNQCLRSGETAIYSEFGFEGAIVSDNLIDGAANGILIVNFNDGGRLAVVSGNLVRNLKLDGPYLHDGAGFGFGIAVEADTVVSGKRHRKRAEIRPDARLGALSAQCRRHRQSGTRGCHRLRRQRRRGRRNGADFRQPVPGRARRRHCRLPLERKDHRRPDGDRSRGVPAPDAERQSQRLRFLSVWQRPIKTFHAIHHRQALSPAGMVA